MKQVKDLKLEKAYIAANTASQKELAILMSENNTKQVFILNRGRVSGIITVSDILSRAIAKEQPNLRAKDLMTQEIVSISPDMTAEQALSLMLKHNQFQLPVINENGRLHGLLSLTRCLEGMNGERE